MNIAIQYYKSPLGELIIGVYDNQLCLCDWRYRKMRIAIDERIQKELNTTYVEVNTALHDKVIHQLIQYFSKERKQFDLPLLIIGTSFQKKVWQLLTEIPFGETNSYKDLSLKYGNLKAIRAVATANGANAISIIIPCHRVIGVDGKLVGYAGGLTAKKKLLEIEMDMFKFNKNTLFA